jgi:hypothetical protein
MGLTKASLVQRLNLAVTLVATGQGLAAVVDGDAVKLVACAIAGVCSAFAPILIKKVGQSETDSFSPKDINAVRNKLAEVQKELNSIPSSKLKEMSADDGKYAKFMQLQDTINKLSDDLRDPKLKVGHQNEIAKAVIALEKNLKNFA